MHPLNNRLSHLGTSVFTVMSQLAHKHKALNLAQGFPEFDVPDELKQFAKKHIDQGHNQYSPSHGVYHLRKSIAHLVQSQYQASVNPETEVTVTSGASEAVFCAIAIAIQPGEEIIILDPAFDLYEPVAQMLGGICRRVPLTLPDFRLDFDALAKAVTPKTRMIVINSPHNPSGTLLDKAQMEKLQDFVVSHDLLILSDEVYEYLVFDQEEHQSVLRFPELYQRSFAVFSFGKTFHATGWKIGYCIAPERLTEELRKIHQYVTFCSSTPFQYAMSEMIDHHPEYFRELSPMFQKKRDLFCQQLEGSQVQFTPSKGTYFQLLDIQNITSGCDFEDTKRWTEQNQVAMIPVSAFYGGGHIKHFVRACFAKHDTTLDEACRRIRSLTPASS